MVQSKLQKKHQSRLEHASAVVGARSSDTVLLMHRTTDRQKSAYRINPNVKAMALTSCPLAAAGARNGASSHQSGHPPRVLVAWMEHHVHHDGNSHVGMVWNAKKAPAMFQAVPQIAS
jgi:hypothetical protein